MLSKFAIKTISTITIAWSMVIGSAPATADQLQMRCDTLYSAMKPLSPEEATELLASIDKPQMQPSVEEEGHVQLRLEFGQGCQWYANKDIATGEVLEHGKPVALGEGDNTIVYVHVEGAPKELSLTPGSDFPTRMQDAIMLLALTENKAVTEFSPFWQLAQHEFTPTADPVDYPEAKERARDYTARFYQNPIKLQAGKGKVSQEGEVIMNWEIDGFKPAEPSWGGIWATGGTFHVSSGTTLVQCQGGWLGRTSQEPGVSVSVTKEPLKSIKIANVWAGQLNQDCVYKWGATKSE